MKTRLFFVERYTARLWSVRYIEPGRSKSYLVETFDSELAARRYAADANRLTRVAA